MWIYFWSEQGNVNKIWVTNAVKQTLNEGSVISNSSQGTILVISLVKKNWLWDLWYSVCQPILMLKQS